MNFSFQVFYVTTSGGAFASIDVVAASEAEARAIVSFAPVVKVGPGRPIPAPEDQFWFTPEEAALYTRYSSSTLTKALGRGQLKRGRRYSRRQLDEFCQGLGADEKENAA